MPVSSIRSHKRSNSNKLSRKSMRSKRVSQLSKKRRSLSKKNLKRTQKGGGYRSNFKFNADKVISNNKVMELLAKYFVHRFMHRDELSYVTTNPEDLLDVRTILQAFQTKKKFDDYSNLNSNLAKQSQQKSILKLLNKISEPSEDKYKKIRSAVYNQITLVNKAPVNILNKRVKSEHTQAKPFISEPIQAKPFISKPKQIAVSSLQPLLQPLLPPPSSPSPPPPPTAPSKPTINKGNQLHEDWEKVIPEVGKPYYYHRSTKVTTYDFPTA